MALGIAMSILIVILMSILLVYLIDRYGVGMRLTRKTRPPKPLHQILKECLVDNPKGTFFVFDKRDEYVAVLKLENIENLPISRTIQISHLSEPYAESNIRLMAETLIKQYKEETAQTNLPWGVYGNDVD